MNQFSLINHHTTKKYFLADILTNYYNDVTLDLAKLKELSECHNSKTIMGKDLYQMITFFSKALIYWGKI